MKIVIPGGTGHVGASLIRFFRPLGHEVVVISRSGNGVTWDGKTQGAWAKEIDGADVVINLSGRSVNCRYTEANMREIMLSRVDSTRAIGEAILQASRPPKVWLQSSTATIYAHRFDAPNDELTGIIGGGEPGAPPKWNASIAVAKAWEATLDEADTPNTRKIALRSAMTMSPDPGSVFDTLLNLTKRGLGGTIGSGRQYMSWIHEQDFCRSLAFLIEHEELTGPINICSPNPIPQREFSRILRETAGVPLGLPAAEWMIEIGTRLLKTESELVLKSRRVVPTRLMNAGFQFDFPEWKSAAADLLARHRSLHNRSR